MICRAGRKSNNVGFFPHRMANPHGESQKMTSHRWAFPFIAACSAKFVNANLTYHLIISKYGKQNPTFKTKMEELIELVRSNPGLYNQTKKIHKAHNWTSNVCLKISKKLDVKRMTGRPIYVAYPSGQGLKLMLHHG